MFKKVVFIKTVSNQIRNQGNYEWLINCEGEFFFNSRKKLEKKKWYEIIYYQGVSGIFRAKEARMIDYELTLPKLNYSQIINTQINIMGNVNINDKHAGKCCGEKCFECSIVVNSSPQEYSNLLKERDEYAKAREKFSIQEQGRKTGFLCLNGKEVKWFATKGEIQEWENGKKTDVQRKFTNLEYHHKSNLK